MKAIRIFGRSIRDAFRNVFRNFSLSIASISCISITLVVVALSLILSINVEKFSSNIKSEVTIVVFMNRNTSKEELKIFETELDKIDNISNVKFVSKEKTTKDMMKENETYKTIIESWDKTENPLKDSYLIKVKKLEDIKKTASLINDLENVDLVNYGEQVSDNLVKMFNFIEKISIIIVAILICVSVFLIVNTIKLTIFNRKREISIMRLVGASNFTIKTPFVVEGMIIGIIGSIVPIIILIFGYNKLYKSLNGIVFSKLFKMIEPVPFVFEISLLVLALGIVVGMLGSLKAVRKYLKV